MTNKFEDFIAPFNGKSDEWARGAATAWQHRQNEVDQLREQLNNMEQCYIQKKKQVEAVEHILGCAMIGPKEVFMYADRIHKALGEEDTSTPQVIIDAERRGVHGTV